MSTRINAQSIMFRRTLRDQRWSALAYTGGAAVYVLVLISFFPSIRENAAQFEQLMEIYPEALKKAFGIEEMTTLPGFVSAEVLSLIWPLVAAVFAITAGSALVAGEIERGTSDFWLSVPVRRWRLLAGKFGALGAGLAEMVVATVGALALGAVFVGESLRVSGLLALGVTLFAFAIAVAAYSTLLSSLFSERGKAGGIGAAILLASYLAWIVASLSPTWHALRYISFFSAYAPQHALTSGHVNLLHIAVLATITVVCLLAALAVFERRDAVA